MRSRPGSWFSEKRKRKGQTGGRGAAPTATDLAPIRRNRDLHGSRTFDSTDGDNPGGRLQTEDQLIQAGSRESSAKNLSFHPPKPTSEQPWN